jgi:hypothetical protein
MAQLVSDEESNRATALLLRPNDELNIQEARQNFTSITRGLNEIFEHHIGAFEFNSRGDFHIHLLCVARADIEDGFDKAAYRQFCRFKRWGRPSWMRKTDYREEMRELPRKFKPNEHLRWIRDRLNEIVQRHEFKHVRIEDVAPLLETPAAYAHYVVEGLYTAREKYAKYRRGTQMIIRPKKLPSNFKGPFSWVGGRSREWRRKNTILASYVGLDATGFIALFPKVWPNILSSLRRRIEEINPHWDKYPSPTFDSGRFFRRALWQQGLWSDELGPEPRPYDEYLLKKPSQNVCLD